MLRIVGLVIAAVLVLVVGNRWYQGHKTEKAHQTIEGTVKADIEVAKNALAEREQTTVKRVETAIKDLLKDPDSATFRNFQVFLDYPASRVRWAAKGATDFVCGEFNAKNAMGGYTGYEPFYWDSAANKVVLMGPSDLAPIMKDMIEKTCSSGMIYQQQSAKK